MCPAMKQFFLFLCGRAASRLKELISESQTNFNTCERRTRIFVGCQVSSLRFPVSFLTMQATHLNTAHLVSSTKNSTGSLWRLYWAQYFNRESAIHPMGTLPLGYLGGTWLPWRQSLPLLLPKAGRQWMVSHGLFGCWACGRVQDNVIPAIK